MRVSVYHAGLVFRWGGCRLEECCCREREKDRIERRFEKMMMASRLLTVFALSKNWARLTVLLNRLCWDGNFGL